MTNKDFTKKHRCLKRKLWGARVNGWRPQEITLSDPELFVEWSTDDGITAVWLEGTNIVDLLSPLWIETAWEEILAETEAEEEG